jgi:hypothetical protein
MARMQRIVLAVVAGCLFALPTQAQNIPRRLPRPTIPPQGGPRSPLCLQGHTLASCKAFLITEVALHMDDREGHGGDPYFSWNYGVMVNLTNRDAVGAAYTRLGLGRGSESYGRNGWLVRYRRWIVPDDLGLDLSLGRVGTVADDPRGQRYTAELGFSISDISGMFAQAYDAPEGSQASAGFKLGSGPGLFLGLLSLLYINFPSDPSLSGPKPQWR